MVPVFDDTAPYIWAAYGLSAVVIAALIGLVSARARRARARLARLQAEDSEAGQG